MDAELQKNMQILMGGGNKVLELNQAEKQKLSDAYDELFLGLAGTNWARGDKTLGAAWYMALTQIDGMMGAKNKNNPAAMHLNQIVAAQRIRWSQAAMTGHSKDKKMEMAAEAKQKWTAACSKHIGNAMAVINVLIQKYQALMDTPQQVTPTQVSPSAAAIFMSAKQRIMDGR